MALASEFGLVFDPMASGVHTTQSCPPEHKLKLVETRAPGIDYHFINYNCHACSLPVDLDRPPYYECDTCYCYLHKFCAEIPLEIKHRLHPQHLLSLHDVPLKRRCDHCKQGTEKPANFYCCKDKCDFYIDIICASPEGFRFVHRNHKEHPLIPIREESSFFCGVCGTKHEDRSFLCTLCCFWIARECASFPYRLKTVSGLGEPTNRHEYHDLLLWHSDDTRFRHGQKKCDVCAEQLDSRFGFYRCVDCLYLAHLRCETMKTEPFMSILNPATSKFDDEDYTFSAALPPEGELTHMLSLYVRNMPKGAWRDTKIKHEHKMRRDVAPSINDDELLYACNACVQPISLPHSFRGGIYHCTNKECNWVLHQMCLENLPFRLPFLFSVPCRVSSKGILLKESGLRLGFSVFFDGPKSSEKEIFSLFKCHVCHRLCNGYRYLWYSDEKEIPQYRPSKPSPHFGPFGPFTTSSNYKFFDAKCALLPSDVTHGAHKPNHFLILGRMKYGPCPCCLRLPDPGEFIYRCTKCSYNLHPKCALHPSTVRHRYDKHPLKLTFKPVNNPPPDDCFCEICELELNQREWFYHCVECDQFFHIACIPSNDQFSNIKFGGTLKLDCHAHPLTFDRLLLELPCAHCNKIIDYNKYGIAFQCKVEDCWRYQIHWECARLLCINQNHSGSERESIIKKYMGYEERGKAHIEEIVEGKDLEEKNGASTSSSTHI